MSTMIPTAPLAPRDWRSTASRIWRTYEAGRSRAQLRELPDYLLADIGVSRSEAATESSRRFRDLPDWWRN